LSHLDTLLQAQLAGRRQQGSFWSSSGRGILVIAALNIVLLWSVTGGVVWQSYRDAVDDWKRTATNFSLTTAAYTQQTLVATDLMLRSMLDWIADEDIVSETQFADVMKQRQFHDTMRDRLAGLPQVGVASIFDKQGYLLSSSTDWPAPSIHIGQRETFLAQVGPNSRPVSISRAVPDLNTKRWTFYLSRKINSKAGELLGVAVVGIDSDYFASLFRLISLGQDSSVSLFRLDGALLATTLQMPDLMGKTYEDAQPVRMIRDGLSGTAQITHESKWWAAPSDPERRIVSARQVEVFPVLVSVAIGDKTFLGQWRERLYFIITLALLLSAVAVLVTAQILRLSARSEAAARLAAERRLLAALIDTPAALCAVLDQQGRVIYCNDRFRQVVAHDNEPGDILRDEAVRGAAPILAFAAGNDVRGIEVDLQVTRPGEATHHLHFSLSHGSLPEIGDCTILMGHDETLRHQARQAIAQTATLVTLGEMTTGMAHELSQPLNVIKMAAQNALSEVTPAEPPRPAGFRPPMDEAELRPFVAGKLGRIMAQVDRAASVIARMRVFGRTPEGEPAVFDVREACRGALTLVGQRLRNTGVTVRKELGEQPLRVRSHQNLLEQALVNLLVNARDALQQSLRADKTIVLSTSRGSNGHVLITVADNGPGVPVEIRERIFEPFFTSKPTGQGTGLGLSLSFGIVREAGGTLSLLPGEEGAAFQIDLPEAARA
jgi:C4-dicarboxylate-specific signal transduction histidine kinase